MLASDYFFGPPCPPSYPRMEEISKDERIAENKEEDSEGNDASEEVKEVNDDEEQESGVRKRKVCFIKFPFHNLIILV